MAADLLIGIVRDDAIQAKGLPICLPHGLLRALDIPCMEALD